VDFPALGFDPTDYAGIRAYTWGDWDDAFGTMWHMFPSRKLWAPDSEAP